MRVSGFSAIMAGLAASCLVALSAFPIGAEPAPAGDGRIVVAGLSLPAAGQGTAHDSRGPAEAPPPGFAATQYIDSAGCVFLRAGPDWQARLARDGTPICGYPPTMSARRTAPDAGVTLMPEPAEPRAARIERALSDAIIPNLHDGELRGGAGAPHLPVPADTALDGAGDRAAEASLRAAAHPAPAKPRPETGSDSSASAADPRQSGGDIAAAVAAQPVLSTAMSSIGRPAARLCSLLAADALGSAASGSGRTLALGLCRGDAVPLGLVAPEASVSTGARSGIVTKTSAAKNTPAPQARRKAGKAEPAAVRRRKPAGARKTAGKGRAMEVPDRPAPGGDLVPAGARFVQIGAFAPGAGADQAAARLAGLGMPVSRTRQTRNGGPVQIIMAGPFEGREAVVRAIDRLRRAGYPNARAR